MRALFLGHFAATVAPRILAKVTTPLETSILDDEADAVHAAPLLTEAEIVVGHIWRADFPPHRAFACCNRLRLDSTCSTPQRSRKGSQSATSSATSLRSPNTSL